MMTLKRSAASHLKALGCMMLLVGLAPGTADATITFGVDLNRLVDSSVSCAAHPIPPFGTSRGGPSCTWFTYGKTYTVNETTEVPVGSGTITKVRVKEGANPGPMKITVLRQQGFAMNGLATACCVGVAESQTFTPSANAITEVPVHMSVFNGTNPATGVPSADFLAISVLNTNTSVPLSATPIDGSYLGTTFYPAVNLGQERLDGGITNYGYIALINADWEPTPPSLARVRLASTSFKAKQGTTLRLTLSGPATVRVAITQKVQGRKVHGRCNANAKRGTRCTTIVKRATLTRAGIRGSNTFKFRVPSLAPGRYTATITASNTTGGTSRPSTLAFTIKKPK